MTTTNSTVLKIMNILFWIVFIGLCIKTGALLTSFIVSLFVNPESSNDLYLGLNLFDLYSFSKSHYIFTAILFMLLTGLKAYITYYVVKIFMKFDLSKPFHGNLNNIFIKISYIALGTGLLAIIAENYAKWIMKKGVTVPIDWTGSEILLFAGVIYLFALIFKKGSELQSENDLTV
ncbi:DUF2975 domain-containing protein [Flavobacterium macrobrachii]|uniref:DUF2975 domain-containing protein n=1 Tax=Flavobacterium macrobrachii TaxID=591204 RepID=A0ABS2CTX1_9FLAO|nr:DUF2975 domain-containing protein [Flavobacterium macrobrachii]MBM6497999.1 DUF2975 domain-containing protein [Flavobacterium macrobrachii]